MRGTTQLLFLGVVVVVASYSLLYGGSLQPTKWNFNPQWAIQQPDQPEAAEAEENSNTVKVLMWNVGEATRKRAHWAFEEDVEQNAADGRACPVACTFTSDLTQWKQADAVLFEPTLVHHDSWMRTHLSMPEKYNYQQWVLFHYTTPNFHPLLEQPLYKSYMDIEMSYNEEADVRISQMCSWTSSATLSDFLKPPAPRDDVESASAAYIAFVSSNCNRGPAAVRTAYVKQLMKFIAVDALGECLHNTPAELGGRTYAERAQLKLEQLTHYKFVLVIEADNVTNFVTDSLAHAFLAGAIPVYMGASNIEDYLPGDHSIIAATDFDSPEALAKYMRSVATDPDLYNQYFHWKSKPLRSSFEEAFERCVHRGAACRLCQLVANRRSSLPPRRREFRSSIGYALEFSGKHDYVLVPDTELIHGLSRGYTLSAWVLPKGFDDVRILDKNPAGRIDGFNLDLQLKSGRGYLRLCAGDACFMTRTPLEEGVWSHITLTWQSSMPSVFDNQVAFYINGILDSEHTPFVDTQVNDLPLLMGKANGVGTDRLFTGALDSIWIWNRAVDAETVRRMMFCKPRGDEEGLVAHWDFDEPNGMVAYDTGINEQHASIIGAPKRIFAPAKPMALNKCA